MQVGCLGNIVFKVSAEAIETITNFVWSGKARYGVHKRHLTNALTEYEGNDPETITFDIELSADLGVNPMSEFSKIVLYMRYANILPLVIGGKPYGKYRWTIQGFKKKAEQFSRTGKLTQATVTVDLLEYLKE